jgi:hypothetical protein
LVYGVPAMMGLTCIVAFIIDSRRFWGK